MSIFRQIINIFTRLCTFSLPLLRWRIFITEFINCSKLYSFCCICLLRHIVFPLLIALFCYAFKVNGKLSRQCIIMGCLPSASASFPLEAEADLKPGLASTLIFWTTIFCVPFQILWLFVMNQFNIFPE